MKEEGCRSIVIPADLSDGGNKEFNLIEEVNITTNVSYRIFKLVCAIIRYIDQNNPSLIDLVSRINYNVISVPRWSYELPCFIRKYHSHPI